MIRLRQHRGTFKTDCGGVLSIIAGIMILFSTWQEGVAIFYNKNPYVRITHGLIDEHDFNEDKFDNFGELGYLPYLRVYEKVFGAKIDLEKFGNYLDIIFVVTHNNNGTKNGTN